jgi:hypothetical protein
MRSEWDVADDLARGTLVEVLRDWRLPQADVVALIQARYGRTARTQRFTTSMPLWTLHPGAYVAGSAPAFAKRP